MIPVFNTNLYDLNKDFLVYSESTYISNKNKINLINEHQIEFTKLFFDVDDSFSFNVTNVVVIFKRLLLQLV